MWFWLSPQLVMLSERVRAPALLGKNRMSSRDESSRVADFISTTQVSEWLTAFLPDPVQRGQAADDLGGGAIDSGLSIFQQLGHCQFPNLSISRI